MLGGTSLALGDSFTILNFLWRVQLDAGQLARAIGNENVFQRTEVSKSCRKRPEVTFDTRQVSIVAHSYKARLHSTELDSV